MSKAITRTLSGIGDPNAPVGSKEWLEYVVNYAKSTARDVSAKCGDLQKILKTMQECDAHKAAGFVSFEAFLSRRVGISSDQAKAVLDAKPSVKVAAVLRKVAPTGRPPKGTKLVPLSKGGNDRIQSQIATRRPDIAQRLQAVEFSSVRQAAIAAGIVKVPSVLDQLRKLWAKATEADRRTFMQEVGSGR